MKTARSLLCLALLATLAAPLPVAAQSYPEKNIRMIVAFATGASYVVGILLSEKLRDVLGHPAVPDFRPGAGGNLASGLLARAPADGYTILLTSPTVTISPSLFPKLEYDTLRDFAPVTLVATVPNVLVIHPSVPARNLQELVKLARTHPGKLTFGSGGVGSGSQLGSELFKAHAGIDMVHVPYKGAALALTAMLGGEVDIVTSTVPATIPHIKSGRIRGIAVMGPERVPALPDVPTTAEVGMPEVVVITWYGMFAPAGVKPEIIGRLNAAVTRVMRMPDVKAKLASAGLDAVTMTPGEFDRFVRDEIDKWARVIKAANIRVQ
jgi:tripartite-type tricarboxylate transporter receptor subunit TctC